MCLKALKLFNVKNVKLHPHLGKLNRDHRKALRGQELLEVMAVCKRFNKTRLPWLS